MKTTVKGIASAKRRKDFLREIRQIVDQIVDHFSPSKVILFGSHARGRPVRDSDVDLLVITDEFLGPNASLKIRRAVEYSVPLDVLVYDCQHLTERMQSGDYFLQDIVESGKVLYERPDR